MSASAQDHHPPSTPDADLDHASGTHEAVARFSPEEEAALLDESNIRKAQANKLYSSAEYSQAVGEYDKALASCPNYLEFEIAVLKSNIAACHLRLDDWTAAVESAAAALDALERLAPTETSRKKDGEADVTDGGEKKTTDEVVELEGTDEQDEFALKQLELSDQRKEAIQKLRGKALMRRAKAKSELGGWGNLQGAEDDYKALSAMAGTLGPADRKIVLTALKTLPPRIDQCKQREMGEMMGKLKELGNGILKPFGLSTDNFNMVKDEKTGGYSMNFNQGK